MELKEKMVRILKNKNRHSGFAMMEVLMTILVISVGALGLAGLQLASMKYNKDAAIRTKATSVALELSDRMRANLAGVRAGSYNQDNGYAAAKSALAGITAPGCGTSSDCTSAQLANLDLKEWETSILATLPQGTGAVVPIAGNAQTYDIVVMWLEKSLQDDKDGITTDGGCKPPLVAGVRCLHTPFIP